MSIRNKILLPMLITLVVATALVGIIGQRSLSAARELASLTEDALHANEAARTARDGFARGEVILGRVMAMTDLVDPARIEGEFGGVAADVEAGIGRLKAASRSERMSVLSGQASTIAAQWRADAEIVLGIRQAREVPTAELMNRHSRILRAHLDEAVALAGRDARTRMAATEGAIAWQLWLILGIGSLVGTAGVIAAFLIAGSLSKPLVRLASDAGRLAAGDASVTLADRGRRDEIGAMVAAVQVFRDNLIHTRELEAEAALAREGVEAQRRAGMRDLADGFQRAVGGIIGTVATAASDLQANARSMTASASEAVEQSGTVAASAGDAASNVGMVAAAAEELGTSVQEVSRQVEGSAHLTRLAVTEASQTAALVRELSEAAARIGDVTAMISTVASQTNLLALNATIEAARAGAAGRGFAVVASEVKELAGQTARATDEIGMQIGRIQASTGQAVQVIDRIAARIAEISDMANMISASVQQQGAATQEIARNAVQAAAGTSLVNTNIAGVAGVAGRTGTAASKVLSSASELSRQSDHLKEEVTRFLANVRAA